MTTAEPIGLAVRPIPLPTERRSVPTIPRSIPTRPRSVLPAVILPVYSGLPFLGVSEMPDPDLLKAIAAVISAAAALIWAMRRRR